MTEKSRKAVPKKTKGRSKPAAEKKRSKPTTSESGPQGAPAEESASSNAAEPSSSHFPVICIGASAGGLEPLQTFFSSLGKMPCCAYVVITHLEATQPSLLPQLIQRHAGIARLGLYPAAFADDMNKERLDHFFTKENSRYRIRREIREMLIFAPQNLIKDPPFSDVTRNKK